MPFIIISLATVLLSQLLIFCGYNLMTSAWTISSVSTQICSLEDQIYRAYQGTGVYLINRQAWWRHVIASTTSHGPVPGDSARGARAMLMATPLGCEHDVRRV